MSTTINERFFHPVGLDNNRVQLGCNNNATLVLYVQSLKIASNLLLALSNQVIIMINLC